SVYLDGECVRLMKDGYSQIERNLEVTIQRNADRVHEENFIVGWMGRIEAGGHGGTQCRGAHNSCHIHCPATSHSAGPKNCIGHPQITDQPNKLVAPELNYDSAVE